MDDGLARVLARRVERTAPAPVDGDTVARWCARFGEDWAVDPEGGVPVVMYPTFLRPGCPSDDGRPATGVLGDELTEALGLPAAIAVGYELDLIGALGPGDRLAAVERVAWVGAPRSSRLGDGRDWVIEVSTSILGGAPVGVERFRMFGYRSGADGVAAGPVPTVPTVPEVEVGSDWSETVPVDAGFIVGAASAHRVWAPAHHRADAARAAGLPDIILDTSSQTALFAGAARRRRPGTAVRSVELSMRRPILPGVEVVIGGVERDDHTVVTATVDGTVASRSVVRFAT